ncbi:unnamed protein product [Adineta ricciae]|uniref:Ubiquinone biosynthesis protein n=1 Tax=Adineta ricciae TaxID=249248 RepID=A0A813U3U9_ADIRI|nr:unnamed protein product [Adineta ricciae]CAF1263788.1 unnamed protein product [Adineta ricciae]
MQRLAIIRCGTSSLNRVVDICQQTISARARDSTIKRTLSINSHDQKNELGIDTKSYKPSTAKTETHVPDDLKGGQPIETIDKPPRSTATLTSGGKVWSVQNPGSVHIAPLGATATTFVPAAKVDGQTIHETTVHTTQGELNIADPFKTHVLQPEATPAQLAEAAAVSAFEPFAPDTPLTTTSPADTVFAPKISSTELYSATSSPTAHYEKATPSSSTTDTTKYEAATKSTVFGGLDTLASTKKHPQYDPFDAKPADKTKSAQEIPIQRESDIRDEILRESLNYVNEQGWTMDAIRSGVRASNQPTTVEGLFSNGYDLVEYFMRDANAKMSAYMNDKAKNGNKQGSHLLIDGLKHRLSLVVPYANTWDQALAQGALPQNAMRGWKNLLDLAGDAWHGIGDTSTDMNWYSKRLLLAAVYKSAEIYMIQDQSPDKVDTMNFLERRLGDFQAMGSVRNSVSKSLSDTAQIASGLFSVVRNLTSRR